MTSLGDMFPKVSVQKARIYRWGDPNPVHEVSYPSIAQEHLERAQLPDYDELRHVMRIPEDQWDGLLNPEDGSYPHIEYIDLTWDERREYLRALTSWAVARLPDDLSDFAEGLLASDINTVCDKHKDSVLDAVRALQERIENAVAVTKKENDGLPKPARAGHLMAEGRAYAIAKEAVENKRYSRKVTFNEPVNAFTMLHGDTLAVGGDMLTAVTVTSTEEHQIKDYAGRPKTVHTSWAVSI